MLSLIGLQDLSKIMNKNGIETFYAKRSAAYWFRDDAFEEYNHTDIEFIGNTETIAEILNQLNITDGNKLLVSDFSEVTYEYYPSLEESVKHKKYTIDCIYKRVSNNHYIDTVGGIKDTIGMKLVSPSTRNFEIKEDDF